MATTTRGFGFLDGEMFKNASGKLEFPIISGAISGAIGKVVTTISDRFTNELVGRLNTRLDTLMNRGKT